MYVYQTISVYLSICIYIGNIAVIASQLAGYHPEDPEA